MSGWLTEMDGETVIGTRFATFKYDASHAGPGAPPAQEFAYFPPDGDPFPVTAGENFKVTAMTVDPFWGDIYICGHGPRMNGSPTADDNYIVIKYDKDLGLEWVGYYDGPISEHDTPVDIMTNGDDATVVVVTGHSLDESDPPHNTQYDITTVAWEASGGARATSLWPDVGWGGGVRRYDYATPDFGSDFAVGLGNVHVVSAGDTPSLNVLVGGTSWDAASGQDFTVHYWSGPGASPLWSTSYDNGDADWMTAMSPGDPVFVTGYSENPVTGKFDYATQGFYIDYPSLGTTWPTPARWNYTGGNDIPRDMSVYTVPSGTFGSITHIWITGAGEAGSRVDATTIHYAWDGSSITPTEDWSDGWSLGHDFSYGRAVTAHKNPERAYIAGALGGTTSDSVLILKYEDLVAPTPPYEEDWFRTYHGGGALTALPGADHEGGRIIVQDVEPGPGEPSVFVAGVSTVTGKGRQFTTLRFQED